MSSLQEFCKKYPEYCNQELYERITKKGAPSSHPPPRRVYASEVSPGMVGSVVMVEGVVMDVMKREYPRRSGQGVVRVTGFTLYDKTGKLFVKNLGETYLELSDGEIVRITGRVEEWRGNIEVRVFEIERLGKIELKREEVEELTTPPESPPEKKERPQTTDKKSEGVGKVLALLRSAREQGKHVYYDRLIPLLGKLGIEFKDIEPYVVVREVTKPGSLEKVKVVELKE